MNGEKECANHEPRNNHWERHVVGGCCPRKGSPKRRQTQSSQQAYQRKRQRMRQSCFGLGCGFRSRDGWRFPLALQEPPLLWVQQRLRSVLVPHLRQLPFRSLVPLLQRGLLPLARAAAASGLSCAKAAGSARVIESVMAKSFRFVCTLISLILGTYWTAEPYHLILKDAISRPRQSIVA